MSNSSSSFGKWLAGIAASVTGALIIWWLTHPGGPFNPIPPTATLAPEPEWTETSAVIVTFTPSSTPMPLSSATPTETETPTFTPLPTATALIDAYSGTWVYPGTDSGTLPFALYRLKIENVNSQDDTATFNACRCTHKESCENKSELTPSLASAAFEGSKLVAEPVYIDQQRTVQWTLKAIRLGQNLIVTVEQYKDNVKVGGPEDFVLNPPKFSIPALGQAEILDECDPPPVIYLGP